MVPLRQSRATIRDKALSLGFDAVGFADVSIGAAGNHLSEFLHRGYHGDMGWMESTRDRRQAPDNLWADARSIVAVGVNYGPDRNPLREADDPGQGTISVYARGRDYHLVLKKRLRLLARWISESWNCEVKLFTDTAPVMEKPVAQRAGLGWQGKHTNLVSRRFGSWLFLGEVFTTLDIPPDQPGSDHCGTCTQCLDVCPTQAFPTPYQLDARRCLSYLTIEHKGHIAREFRRAMGSRIYGCDDCLAVCPWNSFARPTPHAELDIKDAERQNAFLKLSGLVALDDAAFRDAWSGSAVKRLGRDRFVRNVLIAIGNSADRSHIPNVIARLDDSSPLVRAMAVWALAQLAPPALFHETSKRSRERETDLAVLTEWDAGPGEETASAEVGQGRHREDRV